MSPRSHTSCWWILAAIPFLALGSLLALDALAPNASSGSNNNGDTPDLDFGTGSMFDQIATRYDTINRVLALRMDIGWRRQMTTRIRELLEEEQENDNSDDNNDASSSSSTASSTPTTSWRILDVATGTADVALQLVEDLSTRAPSSSGSGTTTTATVLGLDPSANMLAVGRSKIHHRGLGDRIVLEQADARDLSHYYEDASSDAFGFFDAATVAFGIRNVVPNRDKALCEMHKLLKPNGVLAVLEFSQPSYETDGVLGAAAGLFIRHVVPIVGGLLSGGAKQEYRHLQNSIGGFPKPQEFNDQLQSLRCALREDDPDHYFYVGHYEMEEVRHMNFGSVQLYIGRAVVRAKAGIASSAGSTSDDAKLPPIVPESMDGEL